MAGDGKKNPNASKRSKQQRKYNSKPAQKKRRAQRNAARREAIKDGRASKGDGKDIDHKNKGSANGNLDSSNPIPVSVLGQLTELITEGVGAEKGKRNEFILR